MESNRKRFDTLVALAALGGSTTGVLSLVGGLLSFSDGSYSGMGLCLIAAALSFGLLANAILRQ